MTPLKPVGWLALALLSSIECNRLNGERIKCSAGRTAQIWSQNHPSKKVCIPNSIKVDERSLCKKRGHIEQKGALVNSPTLSGAINGGGVMTGHHTILANRAHMKGRRVCDSPFPLITLKEDEKQGQACARAHTQTNRSSWTPFFEPLVDPVSQVRHTNP